MQRKDFYAVGILYLIMLLIFYPLFYSDYIYMDEALQIWLMKPGTGFIMFLDDGRALTEWLQYPLWRTLDSIHAITYVRIISLVGWMICVPVWYWVIKRIMNNSPTIIPAICNTSLSFIKYRAISAQHHSCRCGG